MCGIHLPSIHGVIAPAISELLLSASSEASETLIGLNNENWRYMLFMSERSERDTIRGNKRKSEIYLASERSERDTLRCNAIEISLYLFIYLFIWYVGPLFLPALLITSW